MAGSIANSSVLGKKSLSVEGSATFEMGKGTIRKGGDTYLVRMMTDDTPDPLMWLEAYPSDVEKVVNAYGLKIGDKSPDHFDLYVSSLSYSEAGPGIWEVKVEYSNPAEEEGGEDKNNPGGGGGDPDKPWTQPPQASWSTETGTVARLTDASGIPLNNSAGMTFQGGAEFPIIIPTVTITWTTLLGAGPPPMTAQKLYVNKVNADKFGPWQPGQALIRALDAQTSTKDGINLIEYSVTIAFKSWIAKNAAFVRKPDVLALLKGGGAFADRQVGWHKVLVDQGPFYLGKEFQPPNANNPGGAGKYIDSLEPFIDKNGSPFVGLLNGRGRAHPIYENSKAKPMPYFLIFDEFDEITFKGVIPVI